MATEITISPSQFDVTIAENGFDVAIAHNEFAITFANGISNYSVEGLSESYITADPISGHRAISTDADGLAIYTDKTESATAFSCVGISTGAAILGAAVNCQYSGKLVNVGWSWTAQSPIFVTTDGNLSQTAPTSGFRLIVGYAIDATSIFIQISEPIFIA